MLVVDYSSDNEVFPVDNEVFPVLIARSCIYHLVFLKAELPVFVIYMICNRLVNRLLFKTQSLLSLLHENNLEIVVIKPRNKLIMIVNVFTVSSLVYC